MKRFFPIFLCLFLLTVAGFAQSGRKAVSTPKPTPVAVNADDPSQFSESKPRPPRTYRKTDKFPDVGDRKSSQTQISPQTPLNTADDDNGEILRVETNLITIPVSVFDRNGLYIKNLRQQDFRIFEDGKEQEIAYFGATDKPFTVALLLDTSLSSEFKLEDIKRSAKAFVDQLEPQDSVLVIEFNGDVKVRTKATNNREQIYKAIDKADFNSGTSLYNAVDEALRKQLSRIAGRKAVVLFTDGVDTTSRKNSYDGTLSYAEESDSLIFPIYYNTFFDVRGRQNPGIWGGLSEKGTRSEDYALGRKYLEDLADVTGGRVFRPESTPGGLTAAFEGIAEELRRQYNIGYVPKEEGKTGQRKQIKVRVSRPNLVIRTRDSYIVGSSEPSATPAK
ncbi:MAG: VWA domain-containing protein [Chloracidobacterium sp.]|nr:VWA domain-containing protein [Chloracidobacterium sp.]